VRLLGRVSLVTVVTVIALISVTLIPSALVRLGSGSAEATILPVVLLTLPGLSERKEGPHCLAF
jgi:hypothetical protein